MGNMYCDTGRQLLVIELLSSINISILKIYFSNIKGPSLTNINIGLISKEDLRPVTEN